MRAAAALAVALAMIPVHPVRAEDRTLALAHYTTATWTEKDGLPSSLIWSIAQDQQRLSLAGHQRGAGSLRWRPVRSMGEAP